MSLEEHHLLYENIPVTAIAQQPQIHCWNYDYDPEAWSTRQTHSDDNPQSSIIQHNWSYFSHIFHTGGRRRVSFTPEEISFLRQFKAIKFDLGTDDNDHWTLKAAMIKPLRSFVDDKAFIVSVRTGERGENVRVSMGRKLQSLQYLRCKSLDFKNLDGKVTQQEADSVKTIVTGTSDVQDINADYKE